MSLNLAVAQHKLAQRIGKDINGLVESENNPWTTYEICSTVKDPAKNERRFICFISGGERYGNKMFTLHILIPNDYPVKSPSVGFAERGFFHSNVRPDCGSICVSTLNQEWTIARRLATVIYTDLSWILHNPNHNDPLNAEAASLGQTNDEVYNRQCLLCASTIGYSEPPTVEQLMKQCSRQFEPGDYLVPLKKTTSFTSDVAAAATAATAATAAAAAVDPMSMMSSAAAVSAAAAAAAAAAVSDPMSLVQVPLEPSEPSVAHVPTKVPMTPPPTPTDPSDDASDDVQLPQDSGRAKRRRRQPNKSP